MQLIHSGKEPKVLSTASYGRVSFIGHSVGGLIIRKCLEVRIIDILLDGSLLTKAFIVFL